MSRGSSWTVTKDVASWTFALDPPDPAVLRDPAARAPWLAERVERLVKALPPFALPDLIEVSTDSGGDPAFAVDIPGRLPELLAFMRAHSDVWVVNLRIVLQVELLDEQGWYPASFLGAHAALFVEAKKGIIDETQVQEGASVWLTLTLDTELYAPRTFADVKDNRLLAERNGPSLTEFLKRLESDLPARLLEVYSLSFSDQTYPYGFRPPPE